MAEDQVAGPAVEAGESPALRQQAAAPGTVSVSVTYTRADIRSILLMAMPRLTLVFGVVMVALWVLVLILGLALGASLSWDDAQLPGLLLLFALIFFVVLPWRIARKSDPGQSWVVSSDGVHITVAGTDVRHDWARFDEVVIRPDAVQFRIRRCNLAIPLRCLTADDLVTLEALAVAGGASLRRGGRYR